MLDAATLATVGLRHGEPARFRRQGHGRWVDARIGGVAPDGSILVFDRDGAARNLRPETVEVRRPGGRGTLRWRSISDVAITWEQLSLW